MTKNISGIISFGSKDWANHELRFAIGVLKGKDNFSLPNGRLQIALYVKDLLTEYGYFWQAKRLENWIHRFQRGDFTASAEADSQKRKREASLC